MNDELGLNVGPYLWAQDLGREVTAELDEEPFDPAAEEKRAKKIASLEKYGEYGSTMWLFSEPLFPKVPSPQRAEWWASHLTEHGKTDGKGIPVNWAVSAWLRDLTRPAAELLTEILASLSPMAALALRPIFAQRSEAELEEARALVPAELPELLRTDRLGYHTTTQLEPTYFAAATLGMHSETIRAALGNLTSKNLGVGQGVEVVWLAETPEERVRLAQQIERRLSGPEEVVPWLVLTGTHGLPLLLESVRRKYDPWTPHGTPQKEAETMVRAAASVITGPGGVPFFIEALDTKGAGPAAEWLREHADVVLGSSLSAEQAEAVAPILRSVPTEQLRSAAPQGSLAAVVKNLVAEADLPTFDATAQWWQESAEHNPKGAVPKYLGGALPPVLLDGARLADEQVAQLVVATKQRSPLVDAVRQRADPASLDRFAVAMLESWIRSGAASKDGWLMTGAGHLGGDRFVATLTPMVREWPGQSQHKRAVNGLSALGNVGTDAALQSISGIANKVKFAALKRAANQAMQEIAAARGMSRDELEDRVVPDGGLDERGTRTFSYGAREFRANVTPEGKVVVRLLEDGTVTGKPKTTLPAPNQSDDAELAAAAKDEFKVFKKQVTDITKLQTKRFELAMLNERRWSGQEFQELIVAHPVLKALLSGVVWGSFDPAGALSATFRIDDEGQLIDVDDEPVELEPTSVVGVVHRLHLSDEEASQWAEVLADFELTAPFKQLDRPVFTLPADQGDDQDLHGVPTSKLEAYKLVGAFNRYGWERGEVMDGGVHSLHALPLSTADITAVVEYEPGMWMGSPTDQEEQTIEHVYLLPGVRDPKAMGYGLSWHKDPEARVPWSQAPAVLVSEVMAMLSELE